MAQAIDETTRRRAVQVAYNLEHGIEAQPLRKKIANITDLLDREDADTAAPLGSAGGRGALAADSGVPRGRLAEMPAAYLANLIGELSARVHQAASELHFELADRVGTAAGPVFLADLFGL